MQVQNLMRKTPNKNIKKRIIHNINFRRMDSKIWPINLWYIEAPFRNGEEGMTHRESVEEVKRKYNVRFNIVDAAINSL